MKINKRSASCLNLLRVIRFKILELIEEVQRIKMQFIFALFELLEINLHSYAITFH